METEEYRDRGASRQRSIETEEDGGRGVWRQRSIETEEDGDRGASRQADARRSVGHERRVVPLPLPLLLPRGSPRLEKGRVEVVLPEDGCERRGKVAKVAKGWRARARAVGAHPLERLRVADLLAPSVHTSTRRHSASEKECTGSRWQVWAVCVSRGSPRSR